MPEARAEDMKEPISIPTKPLIQAIPTDDEELRELREDLRAMGCACLLAQPWNVQADDVLREFRFERAISGNKLRGEIWNTGLGTCGLGFTGFIEVLRKDEQAVRMVCSPENSKGRLIRRRASTRRTA